MSSAAPAIAASSGCTPQTASAIQAAIAFNGRISTWDMTRNPATAPAVVFNASYNGLSNVAILLDDPARNATTTTTLQSPPICLAPGTYSFAFDSRLYNANPRNLQLRADVVNQETAATIGNTVTFSTGTGTQITSRTKDTVTIVVAQRTQVRFRYRWDFLTAGTGTGDDIAVTAPIVSKTA